MHWRRAKMGKIKDKRRKKAEVRQSLAKESAEKAAASHALKITIWDMDAFYHLVNNINPMAMRVSSYYKQLGCTINFVTYPDDIGRPFDLCFLFKDMDNTPLPPTQFFVSANPGTHIYYYGASFKTLGLANWEPSNVRLALRPDYTLYPETSELNGVEGKTQFVHFLDNQGRYIQKHQDYKSTNPSGRKITVDDDTEWGKASAEDLIKALTELGAVGYNIQRAYPFPLEVLLRNQEAANMFVSLPFARGYKGQCRFTLRDLTKIRPAMEFLNLRVAHTNGSFTSAPTLLVDITDKDCQLLERLIVEGKRHRFKVNILNPGNDKFLKAVSDFMTVAFNRSWLEYVTLLCSARIGDNQPFYWSDSVNWSVLFRELIAPVWKNEDFVVARWGDDPVEKELNKRLVPWPLFRKEFGNDTEK